MSEKSAPGDPITADGAPAPVEVARPSLKANARVQDWYRARIVVAGFVILAVVGGVLAMVTTYSKPSPPATNAMLGGKLNTGKIMSYVGPDKECREQIFDNVTGQMTKPAPCDLNTYDSNAASSSVNATGRLESISKAFSGR
jgi:hypothetical protein